MASSRDRGAEAEPHSRARRDRRPEVAGRPVAIGKNRGDALMLANGLRVFVTVHPSSLLRAPDEAARHAFFVKDLRAVGALAASLPRSAPLFAATRSPLPERWTEGGVIGASASPKAIGAMNFDLGFLASIVVVLLASRLLGEAAQRLGQPVVIGQLVAGIMLGPSFLGLLWPDAERALFSADPVQKATLHGFGEFGILLLLALTGMEVDVRLLRKIGPAALSVSFAGIAVPFAFGSALGLAAPSSLIPNPGQRLPTALFLGVALSISSIKVVATVVRDMNFARRDLGQIIVASSIIEDSLCWILIAVILGIVRAGGVEIGRLAGTIAGVALFLAASLTAGRRLVAGAIRIVNDAFIGEFTVLTLILIIIGAMALLTQALGVQSVLGAFVAGVLIGESPILTKRISEQLRGMVSSFFAPIFFALAGLNSDLTILRSPKVVGLTAALILVASAGKFGGAFIGGAIGRLSRAESLALAIGMNARGSTEVIVASVGLSSGALTSKSLLDDRDDGGADDLRHAADPALGAGAHAPETGRAGAARPGSLRGQGLRRQHGALPHRGERPPEWPVRVASRWPPGRVAGPAGDGAACPVAFSRPPASREADHGRRRQARSRSCARRPPRGSSRNAGCGGQGASGARHIRGRSLRGSAERI